MDQPARTIPESYLPRFRLETFRPGQQEVIETVLAGQDCLCVMPTGGGKSLCYQLPALVLDGLTVVVSPLIALMKDQVDQLQALNLPVTFINSTLSMSEQHARLDGIADGRYRLAYVVPERFRSARFLEAVRTAGIKLLAVDEAHCISQWGHDFRPDYARLGNFRRILGNPTTIALTATATDAVRRDIVEQLHIEDGRIFITGFARDNLFYAVQRTRGEKDKNEKLLAFLRSTPGSGIIYTSTRKRTEEVAEKIAARLDRSAVAYHAGLLPDQRRTAQEAFIRGRTQIVVATNAFGMGIDKANVRFVVHYNLPGTLEAYYQEAGRAGRDGEPSKCLLLYNASDRFVQEYFIESAYPAPEMVAQVYQFLRAIDSDPIELTQQEIKDRLGISIGAEGVGTCEQLLESAGVLERMVTSENRAIVRIDSDLPTLADLLPKQAKRRRVVLQAVERLVGTRRNELVHFQLGQLAKTLESQRAAVSDALRRLNELNAFTYVPPFRGRAIRMIDRTRPFEQLEIDFDALGKRREAEYEKLNRVISFSLAPSCRQQAILHYFGEKSAAACGHCDNCRPLGIGTGQPVPSEPPNEKTLTAVRKALSGVARTQQRFRCGKNLIAQMLCGSGLAKIKKLGLDSLSTFGILSHLQQSEVVDLIEALTVTGHLQQVELDRHRPVVELTAAGTDLMKGNGDFEGPLPVPPALALKLRGIEPASKPAGPAGERTVETSAEEPPEADPGLLEALQDWRRQESEKTNLPRFRILGNTTLQELAARRPGTPEELLGISGIGKWKLEQYGDHLLRLIEAHGPPDSKPADDADATSDRPSFYWTWRLLSTGFTIEECIVVRGFPRETILTEALAAANDGLAFDPRRCFSPQRLQLLADAVGTSPGGDAVETMLERLPPGTPRSEVELFLKYRPPGA